MSPEPSSWRLQGVVYVADLARTTAFYAEVCGLDVVEHEPDDYATLARDGVEISLVRMPDDVRPAAGAARPARRVDNPVKLSFPVADLAAARARASVLGGEVDDPSAEWAFRGWVHCHGADPEGNVVSFRQPSTPA